MPDRTISILGAVAGSLMAVYLVLVITTVCFAAMQTDLALAVRDAESHIGTLEATYYDQVGALAAMDPRAMNLAKPQAVTYATEAPAPSLSLR